MRLRIGYTDMGEEAWMGPELSSGLNTSKGGHFELRGFFYKGKNGTDTISERKIDTESLVPELIESDDWKGSAVKLWTEHMAQEQEKNHRLSDHIKTGTGALGFDTSGIHAGFEIIDSSATSSHEAPPKYTARHDKFLGIAIPSEPRAAGDPPTRQTTLVGLEGQITLMPTIRKRKRVAPLNIDIHPHKKQKTLDSWVAHP